MYGHVIPNVQLIYICSLTLTLTDSFFFSFYSPPKNCYSWTGQQVIVILEWTHKSEEVNIRNHSFPTLLRFITILSNNPMKNIDIQKYRAHAFREKIRRNSIWLVFLFVTYNFFLPPFYTHLCKRILACTHTCPWQKRPVFTCVRKKAHGFILIIIMTTHERRDTARVLNNFILGA